ncbi:MAG: PDZ domain-containing protein [Patescibacteria group bacterium]|jgi:S1-C subfamily serine protease
MYKKIIKNRFFQIGALALAFSVLGGIVSLAAAKNYFGSDYFYGPVDVSSSLNNGNVIIREPKNVIVQESVKINETAGSVSDSLAGIFKKSAKTKNGGELNKYYIISQEQAQGIVITSDGWILAKNFETAEKNVIENYQVVTRDKKVYDISQAVFDKLSGYAFLKIQANGLSAPSFSSVSAIYPGLTVLAVSWDGILSSGNVAEVKNPGGQIKSSDYNPREIVLNITPRDEFKGTFIFSMGGDLAGYINRDGRIEHINNFLPAIQSLLSVHAVKRLGLGVNYINLKDLVGYPEEKGALIVKSSDGTAVKKDSPAGAAGLAEGSLILSVNGLEIDKNNDLEAILGSYKIGDKIKVKVLDKGKTREVEVKLGEFK